MAAAREHPDVTLQVLEKLNVDVFLLGWNIIAQCAHGVRRGPFGADVAKRIACAGGDDAKIGFE